MRKNYLRELKRRLFLKYVIVVMSITLGGIGVIYLFDDVLNGVIIDFIKLFDVAGDPFATFRRMYALLLPAILVGAGFVLTYYLCKDLVKYMRIMMNGMDDVMQKERAKVSFPREMKRCETIIMQIADEYQRALEVAHEDEEKKKDLIYLLAQDIKMPLTNIIMYLEFLDQESRISTEIKKDYMVKVLHKSLELEDMINEFFDITRFNLQYAKWVPEHMLVDRMMEQVVDAYYPNTEERQMQVILQTPPKLSLYADNDKIARVMRDLLQTLIELGQKGSDIHITITDEENHYEVVMSVLSYHLSAYQIAHLFHNYYRLEDMHGNDATHVMGLGIAKQIIDMHKGNLRASSISDTLTFYITLPKENRPLTTKEKISSQEERK